MIECTHRTIDTNGIRMHVAELGTGPAVVMCHGFPESWYSWRHQMRALAEAGYRAIAPDMRGYGLTDAPEAIDQYTIFHLVGDMVGLLDALQVADAVIVGHDWGAPVAWHAALFRPDRFRAVAGLSVPFMPRGSKRPTTAMPQTDEAMFYQLYFQAPGVAEAELERDAHDSIRKVLYWGSGDRPPSSGAPKENTAMVRRGGPFLKQGELPGALPAWISESDIDFYAHQFDSKGFRGGLNWYRNIDRNWDLLGPWAGAKVTVPALYMAGERDLVVAFKGMERLLPALKLFVPQLREQIMLPACGHWTQQERPAEVNTALLRFLAGLGGQA